MKFQRHEWIPEVFLLFSLVIGCAALSWFFETLWIVPIQILLLFFYLVYIRKKLYRKSISLSETYDLEIQKQQKIFHTQQLMLELSNSMIKLSDTDDLLQIILDKAVEVVPGSEYGSLLVMNQDNMLEFRALVGFDDMLYEVEIDPKQSYQWRATDGDFREPIILKNLDEYTKEAVDEETYKEMKDAGTLNINCTVSAPILLNGDYYGSINIDSEEVDFFSSEDAKNLSFFANQASIVIANHQLYEKMLYLSRYDNLTGAMNRYSFVDSINQILEVELDETSINSIALIDFNDFKSINDNYGHAAGDEVLQIFTKRFKTMIKHTDLFSRFGGDEFALIFQNCSLENAQKRLLEISESFERNPIILCDSGKSVFCRFSYGIAESPNEGRTPKQLLSIADKRMYEHKRGSKPY